MFGIGPLGKEDDNCHSSHHFQSHGCSYYKSGVATPHSQIPF